MNTILIIALTISSGLLFWQFVGYPLLMSVIVLRKKPKNIDYSFQPFVSILVPTFNEEKVIANRIENLFSLNYLKNNYEIIIIDSGSEDNTTEIVQKIQKIHGSSYPELLLLNETHRNGKASAINFGKKHSKADFILVTDANAHFDKNVLQELMPHFKDHKVGGVGGRYCVSNLENPLAASTSFYWDLEYIMRIGESLIDSACSFHGEINAWRKGLIDADPHMLTEDLDMCISIRKKGYRIEYEPKAIVYEPAATSIQDQITQRRRTCIGTIQCLFKSWKFFFFPRNLYSGFIFHSHKTLSIISPFLLLSIPIFYFLTFNIEEILFHFIIFSCISVVFLLILLNFKKKIVKPTTYNKSKISIFKLISYVLLNEYLILSAWKNYFTGKYSVLWEKVESTRI